MNMHVNPWSLSPLLVFLTILSHFPNLSSSAPDSFIYAECSQLKYTPGTPYESNVNWVLTSIVNSASSSAFNTFNTSLPGSDPGDVVYGVYQCRGDLGGPDCRGCVASAVTRLGATCAGASGGALQLEGCFVRYDNTSFLGVEHKTAMSDKCGPLIGDDSDLMTRRDAVLACLMADGQFFRVGGIGKMQGVAQCVQDLSAGECQDCLWEAIEQLKTMCGSSTWGDVFLVKCYARYSERGYKSKTEKNVDIKVRNTLIFTGIGAGAGVTLTLVVSISFSNKNSDKEGGTFIFKVETISEGKEDEDGHNDEKHKKREREATGDGHQGKWPPECKHSCC